MTDSLPPTLDGITLTVEELPAGYAYRVTRYANVILRDAFPQYWAELSQVPNSFQIDFNTDIAKMGGNRSPIAKRFDGALKELGWDKQNMNLVSNINEQLISSVRSHEIDMFKTGLDGRFPGIAVEMEWNNKDPFYDRDLSNFYALHRAGALAVGIIVTRGPRLQAELQAWEATVKADRVADAKKFSPKYGTSTTNWKKLMAVLATSAIRMAIEPPCLISILRRSGVTRHPGSPT